MIRQVIIAGLLGALVLVVWTFALNVMLGFRSDIDMKRIPDEQQVYQVLREQLPEPGRYICNPTTTNEGRVAGDEPVFSVLFSGLGHESAGRLMLLDLAIFVLAPIIVAWLASMTSDRVKASYARKVLFYAGVGLLIAVFSDLADHGIGGYPLGDTIALAVNDLVAWVFVGLGVAWLITPSLPLRDSPSQ